MAIIEMFIDKVLAIPESKYVERGQFNKIYFEKALRDALILENKTWGSY